MKKKLIAAAAGCAIVALAAGFAWKSQQPLPVEVVKVEPAVVSKKITEEGVVKTFGQQIITSPVSGSVKECFVKEGQKVKEGDVLFVVDTEPLRQQKEQAARSAVSLEAQVRALDPALEQALRQIEQVQKAFDRISSLYDVGAASGSELENAAYQLAAAQGAYAETEQRQLSLKAQAEAARLQEKQLAEDMAKSTVRAGADGFIRSFNIQKGSYVTPQSDLGIIESGEERYLEALVQTGQAVLLQPGDEVEIKTKAGDKTVTAGGIIKEILPYAVEKQSPLGLTERKVPVRIFYDDELLPLEPGYSADVIFTLAKEEAALAVPKTAVFPYEEGDAVWVVEEDKVRLQFVEQGFASAYDVVIKSGLQPGDLVIINADQPELEEGLKVKPVF